jgi:hypothetical protein
MRSVTRASAERVAAVLDSAIGVCGDEVGVDRGGSDHAGGGCVDDTRGRVGDIAGRPHSGDCGLPCRVGLELGADAGGVRRGAQP